MFHKSFIIRVSILMLILWPYRLCIVCLLSYFSRLSQYRLCHYEWYTICTNTIRTIYFISTTTDKRERKRVPLKPFSQKYIISVNIMKRLSSMFLKITCGRNKKKNDSLKIQWQKKSFCLFQTWKLSLQTSKIISRHIIGSRSP